MTTVKIDTKFMLHEGLKKMEVIEPGSQKLEK